jgi:hypothetical protein
MDELFKKANGDVVGLRTTVNVTSLTFCGIMQQTSDSLDLSATSR